jgi:hypothetical protein
MQYLNNTIIYTCFFVGISTLVKCYFCVVV